MGLKGTPRGNHPLTGIRKHCNLLSGGFQLYSGVEHATCFKWAKCIFCGALLQMEGSPILGGVPILGVRNFENHPN